MLFSWRATLYLARDGYIYKMCLRYALAEGGKGKSNFDEVEREISVSKRMTIPTTQNLGCSRSQAQSNCMNEGINIYSFNILLGTLLLARFSPIIMA
jgi:hypothetical protein